MEAGKLETDHNNVGDYDLELEDGGSDDFHRAVRWQEVQVDLHAWLSV